MARQLTRTESDTAGSRRSWFTTLRLGIAMAAIGFAAMTALVFVPGGAGPSETLAVTDLSGPDRAVDSANGPALTLANDHADSGRYVSANPFTALRHDDGGVDNASFGFGRLSPERSAPQAWFIACKPILIFVGRALIESGYEACTAFGLFTGYSSFVRHVADDS
jgi:hypothetical protein